MYRDYIHGQWCPQIIYAWSYAATRLQPPVGWWAESSSVRRAHRPARSSMADEAFFGAFGRWWKRFLRLYQFVASLFGSHSEEEHRFQHTLTLVYESMPFSVTKSGDVVTRLSHLRRLDGPEAVAQTITSWVRSKQKGEPNLFLVTNNHF